MNSQSCSHCGKKLKRPDAPFCTNCGAPLNEEATQAMTTVHGGALAKIIIHLPGEETQEEFLSKPVTILGRSHAAMIQVASPIVSGQHIKLELTRKGHALTDLDSTNGTLINGQRIKPNTPYPLASHDIIRFADGLGNSTGFTYIAPTGFSEIVNFDTTQTFSLTQSISYIGRNPETAISLDHPAISWNHAKVIKRANNRYTIQDLSSNNGTFLNASQLQQHREFALTRGDVIQIGPFNLVYQDEGHFAPYSAERNFRLEAVELEKTVYPTNRFGLKDKNQPKTILKNLNLVINPREFIAVVGGSGTGKSTLIKALNGLSQATSGLVLVNGDDLYADYNLYRAMMGYVPQEDIIHHGLVVRQALQYAAKLRLPDANTAEINDRINEVLQKVGLTAHTQTMVRNLSGGQRKRVSIAVELLAEPWIFFLDEPTSGLDPGLEKLMMDTLRHLADEGRTIVLITHATNNIIDNSDHLAVLAQGAQLAYFGPPTKATTFFNVHNFADIYTRLSQTFSADESAIVPAPIQNEYQTASQNQTTPISSSSLWVSRYRKSSIYRTYIGNRQSGEVARPKTAAVQSSHNGLGIQLKQFGVLTRRYLDLIRHDTLSLWVLLAVMPIIGLFLLLISNGVALVGNTPAEIIGILETVGQYTIVDQAQTLLFMMALSANLLGVFAASYEIIKEEAIYRRERMVNLNILPYLGSKFVVLGAFMGLQCLLLLLVLAVGLSFPFSGAIVWTPIEFYFTLVFTALASVALGLFISAVATSRDMVIYLVLITLFVQIVFSGAIFELSTITHPLSWLTITRWSLEALGTGPDMAMLNSLGQARVEQEVEFGRGTQLVEQDVSTTITFYISYSHNGLALLSRWMFLWGHTLLWAGLAAWIMKRKDRI